MGKDVKPTSGIPDLEGMKRDLAKKRAQLDVRKESREGMKDSLTAAYKKEIASNLSDDENDIILEGDAVAIAELFETKRQAMVEDRLEDEDKEIELFEEALEDAEVQYGLIETESGFRESNPDLDIEGFEEYLKNDLSPREKQALLEESEGDQTVFLGKVAEKYLAVNGEDDGEEAAMPSDLSDIPGAGGDLDDNTNNSSEDDAYLTSIGLK